MAVDMTSEKGLEDRLSDAIRERVLSSQVLAETISHHKNMARNFSIVRRVVDSMRHLPDLSMVYIAIVDIVVDEIEAENCSLMILDRYSNELVVKVAKGKRDKTGRFYDDKISCGKRFAVGTGIAGMVAKEGKPVIIGDTSEEKMFVNLEDSEIEVRSLLCVPVLDREGVIGVFNLSHSQVGAFCEDDHAILDAIANLASIALVSAGLFESLQRMNETLESRVREETEKVKAIEGKYRAVVQNATDGMFIVEDSVFRFTNKKFQDLVGYSAQELDSKKFRMVMSPDELSLFFWRMEGEPEGEELPSHYEITVIRKDGGRLEAEVSTAIINYEGRRAIQGILRDITPRKELDRLKSNFLAMAAHELRSPLTLITGYNKMLLKEEAGTLNDLQKKILKECNKNGKRLNAFAREVLELSKIEAGRMEFKFEEADIGDCIDKGLKQVKHLAKKKRVGLKKKLPYDLPKLPLDRGKIRQVLVNLVENAISFSPPNEKVEIEARLASRGVVEVSVVDSGPGIPEDERELIFDEFMVGKKVNNREGTGLGLAICKKIIEAHKGRIWVKSQEGGGSRFIFVLPVAGGLCEQAYKQVKGE